eukprot:gene33841-43725_t
MSNTLYVTSVIAAYWIVSISMVYLNKMLLSDDKASIAAPLFITWYQCVITCIICIILGNLGEVTRNNGSKSFLDEFPVVKYKLKTGLSVLPLSLIFVAMVTFNNICLQYVAVSFYNVARCLSLVFNVMFTYIFLGRTTSLLTCSTLLVVMVGFVSGVQGEIGFSLLGTSAGVLASLFVSLNSIFTTKVLPLVDNDKSLILYYNNLNACYLFIPIIFLFEGQILLDNTDKLMSWFFWVSMTVTGVMGFAIGLVTVMQVKATSPLTHNMSGIAKSAFQSLMAYYIWGNEATIKGVAGILL